CYTIFYHRKLLIFVTIVGSYKNRNKKICDLLKIRETCQKRIHVHRGKHECGILFCKICGSRHSTIAACYMQIVRAPKQLKESKKYLYVFYHFYTQQDTLYKMRADKRLHTPNLCVVQHLCTDCLTRADDMKIRCDTLGIREHIFRENAIKHLIELYVREKSVFERIICIAHNASGFDAQFILKYLVEECENANPRVVLNGKNIVLL
ncbi:hypothetical protein TSAR_003370, partial [Trichomalopsis sarcophagae]